MMTQWKEYESELRSGDADRVTAVVDEIREMSIMERTEAFAECFGGVTDLYRSHEDGYVRQSCVRVVQQFAPRLPAAVNLRSSDVASPPAETVHDQTDAVCGFLLEAITDEDGRVRQSAKRALKDCIRAYDALGETATIEALIEELETMAADASGKRAKHLQEATEDAEFFMQSGLGRIIEGFQAEFGDAFNS